MSKSKKIVLWLVSPYLTLIVALLVLLAVRVITNANQPTSDNLFATPPPSIYFLDILGFILGAAGIILVPVSVVMAIIIGNKAVPTPPTPAPTPPPPPADPPPQK